MLNLLKETYIKADSIKGRNLLFLIAAVFVIFIPLGIGFGYFTGPKLNKNEIPPETTGGKIVGVSGIDKSVSKTGRIIYVNPAQYPDDNVSYALLETDGKETLLRANDEKLKVSEGLDVRISGKISKTKDGSREIIDVKEVVISN